MLSKLTIAPFITLFTPVIDPVHVIFIIVTVDAD
jgi:hypothetical protein